MRNACTYRGSCGTGRYRLVWVGATLSIVGDGAAWVALAWTAYRIDESAADVGALLVAYTAPVVFGGPLVGLLLDRFDRRLLLVADNVVRSAAMAAVPLLHVFGVLRLWHLFVPGLVGLFHPALAARPGSEAAVLSADR